MASNCWYSCSDGGSSTASGASSAVARSKTFVNRPQCLAVRSVRRRCASATGPQRGGISPASGSCACIPGRSFQPDGGKQRKPPAALPETGLKASVVYIDRASFGSLYLKDLDSAVNPAPENLNPSATLAAVHSRSSVEVQPYTEPGVLGYAKI